MDKNNIIINYYVDWKSSDWMKELFELNGFEYSAINELELWDSLLDTPNPEVPGRAPSLNDNQNGK
jgi:hypothetical protein